jgi:S1-C subfamily serine protease
MNTKTGWMGILLIVVVAAAAWTARGDYVELTDGTVIEGTVLKTKEGYWVKSKDGETHKLTASQVKSTGKGSKATAKKAPSKPAAAGTAKPATPADDEAPASPSGKTTRITDYTTAERRANAVETPMAAVAIWQEFIDSEPSAEELEKAKAELAKWQKLADEGGEKIKGKWVTGDEWKATVKKGRELYLEGARLMQGNQTLQAVEKLKESIKVYPNNFEANFELSFILMIQRNAKEAERYLTAAQRIRPASPEVMANLALIEIDRRQHVKAIEMLHKAAQQGDNKSIVQNLISAIVTAPPAASKNKKVINATQAARLLAAKHGVPAKSIGFVIVPLDKFNKKDSPGDEDPIAAALSSGSGFIITKDGLILTNKHVVEHGKSFLVMINGSKKKQRSAEVVVMDDEQDLALIRVKVDEGEELPIVNLSPSDTPGDGAACTVMGYPLIDRLGAAIKITRGVVSSAAKKFDEGPDVVIDAKVNPGNSGGPILDKYGNVMAIVSMKTLASVSEDTYGLGISAGRIRKFLSKNDVEVEKAEATTTTLDTEEIATKVKPAAVCILATR